jgi:hypothetical protein
MAEENKYKKRPLEELMGDDAVQHLRTARKEMQKSWATLLPPGFVEHRRTARKELLLAIRSALDTALDRLDETKE